MNTVSDHFNKIASSYDQFKKKNSYYYQTLKNAIKKEVKGNNLTILDIGCGTGSILEFLKPKKGIGIDISSKMISIATKKYKNNPNLFFRVHNIIEKPVLGNFNYILFNDVIEHISEKEQALKNISLSMKKNTRLIISMANPLWEPILMILEKLNLKMPEGPHYRISENNLYILLDKVNLKILEKQTYIPGNNFFVPRKLGLLFLYLVKRD